MMTCAEPGLDLDDMKRQWQKLGYAVVRGVFSPEEVEEIKETFEKIRIEARDLHHDDGVRDENDPLYHYPRAVHPHRFNETAKRYMLHPRIQECLLGLFGEEPVACQSMFYHKPPGARGQALHQDNMSLLVEPGTCIAAWTAIDATDHDNGCMLVVPKTNDGNLLCQEKGDLTVSFSGTRTKVPPGKKVTEVHMQPGDTLFFNGSAIHGSGPNRTKDRFRRSFIGHYAAGTIQKVSKFYLPMIKMDGTEYQVPAAIGGGACGSDWEGEIH